MNHAMRPHQKLTASSVVDVDKRTWLPCHVWGEQACFFRPVEEAYRQLNYSCLHRRGLLRARCDDLFQEIFVQGRVTTANDQLQRQLAPWIFTLAANRVRSSSRSNLVPLNAMPEYGVGPSTSKDEWFERYATVQWLERAIAPLPRVQASVQAEVLGLVITIDRICLRDSADILNSPLITIKALLHRARQNLSEALLRVATRRMPGTPE